MQDFKRFTPSAAAKWLRRFLSERGANVSVFLALALLPIIGALGMGAEGGSFLLTQRAMQSAADSAVLAAAQNNCAPTASCHTNEGLPSFAEEANGVTTKMGFPNGGDVIVTSSNTAACPGGGTCYAVSISKKIPLYLLKVVGFTGNATTVSGASATTVGAAAFALRQPGAGFCVQALGASTSAIQFKGSSALDLTGCDMASNGGASCNAHTGDTLKTTYVLNSGDKKDCGAEQVVGTPFVDNYASLKNSIPSDTCGGVYKQSGSPRTQDRTDANHKLTTISGSVTKCGDWALPQNITVTTDSVLTIYNGRLDLAGKTLKTANGAHLTIILTGTSNGGDHIVTSTSGGGVLDIVAPTSGTWSGVAIYQDPRLTNAGTHDDFSNFGNNPQLDVTGLIYVPNGNMDIGGAINHATAGDACLAFIVKSFSVAGTGSIFANPTRECDRAGLTGLNKVNNRVVLVG